MIKFSCVFLHFFHLALLVWCSCVSCSSHGFACCGREFLRLLVCLHVLPGKRTEHHGNVHFAVFSE
uniref:Secreted protein n=1 Tax=Arundo donax TaxID=35708 RepID=A0A0A9FI77_ARUDO